MSSEVARSHRANGSSSSSNHSRAGSSTRSSTARSHPQVESAVTRLLVAIKQLLESLTSWSVGKMTDGQVSDVYVQLGNDFNTCVTAFGAYDIDMRDLLTVPMALRTVLETALAEEPSPANLDVFLPEVRQIITDLLQGLRGKQSIFRQKVADRAQRRQDRQLSDTPRTSRSSSQPRPLPAPSIPEDESGERTSPPPPPAPLPAASKAPIASAIPERVSGGRRKYSHPPRSTGFSDSGQSEGEGSSSSKPRRGSTNRRLVSSSSFGGGEDGGEGLADLAANANMAEERLASTERARRLPLPPSTTPTPAAAPEREDPFQPVPTASARSSVTVTQPSGEKTPPRLPASSPALSPEVKRYSLVDRPLSPPINSSPDLASGPVVNVESASPSPSGSGFLNNLQSPDSPGLSAANNTPAVAKELAELEQTDVLQRKASKRFSSYTFSKMAGSAGLPTLPALPTNGAAGSGNKPGFNKSLNRRSIIAPSASIANLTPKDLETLAEADEPLSPQKSPLDVGKALATDGRETSPARSALTEREGSGPGHSRGMSGRMKREISPAFQKIPEDGEEPSKAIVPAVNGAPVAALSEEPEPQKPSPTPGYVTAYLQVGRSVKKVVIESHNGLSFASLRVLFVDKFSYSPGQENFPAIYIRDPKSDIQYELEDITEIKDGCLLSLNIEPLDQVKQHIDMQMANLSSDIKDLKAAFNSQRRMSTTPMPIVAPPSADATPQQARPTEQQFQVLARRLSKFNSGTRVDEPPMPNGRFPAAAFGAPKMQPLIEQSTGGTFQGFQGMYQTPIGGSYQSLIPQSTGGSSYTFVSDSGGVTSRIASDLKSQFDEVQGLRRDLGVMRQVYNDFMGQAKTAISSLRSQNELVKSLANSKIGGSRAYIDTGKAKLDTRSQNVLTKIEELQDLVEGLRDDVLKRHISPKSNLIKSLKADIEASQKELDSLTAQISTVKPIWKKTWEEELQNIVEEQQFLAHQEEFIGDLIEDHKALMEVFGHVEKVITIRNNTMPSSGGGRGGRVMRTGRLFRPPPPEAGHDGLNTVMLEIRGAAIDPNRRIEAIEASLRAREKARMARSDEFTEELGEFVDKKRLKMTGGIEEAERLRQLRSDHALKNMFSPAAGGVAGGTMVSASGGGFDMGGFGDGGPMGMSGLTFAKAPPIPNNDDPFGSGGNGFGMGGFSFAKAPAIPDSP
ncbi:Bud site selection protein 6 [Tulasnella sp. JGI-2019a]|nr:Bud site selection protein 6 [Tulasnella sp. JGI-2019a]